MRLTRLYTFLVIVFILLGGALTVLASTSTIWVDTNGNVGISTTVPAASLQVGTGSQSLLADLSVDSALIKGNLEFDGKLYGNGSGLISVNGAVSGLTAGYVPRATSSVALGTTNIYDDGTNIGINSVSPTAKLAVDGTVYIKGNVGLGTAAPVRQLDMTGNLRLAPTTSTSTGVIYKDTTSFIHDFSPSGALGGNTFAGEGAGKLTATYNAGIGTSGSYNTGLGGGSLGGLTTGYNNTAAGKDALGYDTTGYDNTAAGYCLVSLVTANNNSTLGAYSLLRKTTGDNNTAAGKAAFQFLLTGTANTLLGSGSGTKNTDGSYNTVLGYGAASSGGAANATFNNNVIAGYLAGKVIQTGADSNILVGYQAADALTTGARNIVIGYDIDPLVYTTNNQLTIGNLIFGTGIDGTGIAVSSGNIGIASAAPTARLQVVSGDVRVGSGTFNNASASEDLYVTGNMEVDGTIYRTANVGIGSANPARQIDIAGSINMPNTTSATTGVIYKGDQPFIHNYAASGAGIGYNTFLGVDSGNFTMTDTAIYNTALGYGTLTHLTDGSDNTAAGYNALHANTSGSFNSALGAKAMALNTSGSYNTAAGYEALYSNTEGSNNIAVGYQALYSNTSASDNVAIGTAALYATTTGQRNVAIGDWALRFNTTGSNNVAVGTSAGQGAVTTAGNMNRNVILGSFAGLLMGSTGANNDNIIIGYQAADALTEGSNNIVIGADIDPQVYTGSNQLTIGNLIFGTGVDGAGGGSIGIGTHTPVSTFEVKGSVAIPMALKTSVYSALTTDSVLLVTGNTTITLPQCSSITGRVYYIKKIDSSATTMTIGRTGTNLIDGASSVTTTEQYKSYVLQCDGTNWWTL